MLTKILLNVEIFMFNTNFINYKRCIVGYIQGTGGSSFANSRTDNGSAVFDSPTGNVLSPIQSFFSSGRGGGTYRQNRTYIYFDTSGITGTVTSATLKITSYTTVTSDVIVLNGNNKLPPSEIA